MFRRRDSQKPAEELYAEFKSNFANIANPFKATTTLDDQARCAMDSNYNLDMDNTHAVESGTSTGQDSSTPGVSAPEWRATPSAFGHSSAGLSSFLHEMSNTFWQPTPTSEAALFGTNADDLHLPGMTPALDIPVSRHHSDPALYTSQLGGFPLNDFHHQHNDNNATTFDYQSSASFDPSASFAPHQLHHNMPYETFQHSQAGATIGGYTGGGFTRNEPSASYSQHIQNKQRHNLPQPAGAEQFRFHTVLNAKTAMIRDPTEVPVTYLNKSQAYTITIRDTFAQPVSSGSTRYRTFVRVSFEDEEQRKRPAHCWQLWTEGRGISESRGGSLRAVEHVSPNQTQRDDRVSSITLDEQNLDGFVVSWTPAAGTAPECLVSLRFNFLSTDFSHSKGVKGIPVRLCAKTYALDESSDQQGSEVCFCKVKLFRDHGAERKLVNDQQSVDKNINKLQAQLKQAETNFTASGKRRRSDSIHGQPPRKVPRNKRAQSFSSTSSVGVINSAEDDLQQKINTLQQMKLSQRDQSIFFLRGEPEDDPDVFPVHYKTTSLTEFSRPPQKDTQASRQKTESPTPSSISANSPGPLEPGLPYPTPFTSASRVASNDWIPPTKRKHHEIDAQSFNDSNPQHLASPPDVPTKIRKISTMQSVGSEDAFDVLGVDQSYQPPPPREHTPVACFFIQPTVADRVSTDHYYRAIYLYERTLHEFTRVAASKSGVDPLQVREVVRIKGNGLQIKVDDEMVLEMQEGQDMTAEFVLTEAVTSDRDVGVTDLERYILTLRY